MRFHPTRRSSLRALLIAVALLVLCFPGVASAVQAQLEMDVRQLCVGEVASLRLVVVGDAADRTPVLPEVSNLEFTAQRPTSEYVSINFQTSRIVTYRWAVRATAVGTAVIGPVELTVGGKRLRVAPLQLDVLAPTPGDVGPNLLTARIAPSPPDLPADSPVPLWQGQTVVYQFSFSHRDQTVGRIQLTLPAFDGFEVVQGLEADEREYALQRGGDLHTVYDRDEALVAAEVGTFVLPATVVNARFPVARDRRQVVDPFEEAFGRPFGAGLFTEARNEVLASNSVAVDIRPLPTEGRPASFDGLVGSFEVSAALAQQQVRVGDSVTLTVTVNGDGALDGLRLPPATDNQQLRVYDDAPESRQGFVGGRYRSRTELKRALVPTTEGTVVLPPIELSWFDPVQERYVSWTAPPMQLEVLPGEPGDAPVVADFGSTPTAAREDVATLGEDILPIHSAPSLRDARFRATRPLPLLLLVVPGLALVWQLGVDLRARGGQRSRRKRAVLARLEALPEARAERLAGLELAFREAAGLALALPPAGVTPERLVEGLPEGEGAEAAALYRKLESARYAGVAVNDLEDAVRAAVKRLLGRVR